LKKMNDIMKATETLQRFEADLAKATDRATTLQTERRKLSFAAHSGDKPARAKLDKLTAESLESGLQIENLMAAVDEAKSRLAEAECQAGLAEQRAKAKEAMTLAEQASKRGARIRDLTQELSAEISGAIGDLRRFGDLGAPVSNSRLLELALTRSVLPQLREVGIDCELVPPGNRHQADVVVDGYVAQATKWADGVLAGQKAAA
jgi:hypothetical protein